MVTRAGMGSIMRQVRFRRIAMEFGYAPGELERLSAPIFGVMPDILVARDDAYEVHSPASGLAPDFS
jgi:hypothetical protein